MLEPEWSTSETNYKAEYHILTSRGRVQFKNEECCWSRLVEALGSADAQPSEV